MSRVYSVLFDMYFYTMSTTKKIRLANGNTDSVSSRLTCTRLHPKIHEKEASNLYRVQIHSTHQLQDHESGTLPRMRNAGEHKKGL